MLDRIDELVIKPVEGSGGYGIVFGPEASEKELATIRRKVEADPRGWIAQPAVQLSTVPTQIDHTLARGTSTCGRSRSTTATRSGAAGRPDAGGAAGGFAGGQLQSGWRLQGHLGAGVARVLGRPRTRRRRGGPQPAREAKAPAPKSTERPSKNGKSGEQQQQQQQAVVTGDQQQQQQQQQQAVSD